MKLETVHKLACTVPMAFCMNLEKKIKPTVRYLKDDLKMTDEEVVKLLDAHPQIFGYSIENNLKPKLAMLVETRVASLPVKEFILKNYNVLSFSLESRIRPRVMFLRSIGKPCNLAMLQLSHPKFDKQFPEFKDWLAKRWATSLKRETQQLSSKIIEKTVTTFELNTLLRNDKFRLLMMGKFSLQPMFQVLLLLEIDVFAGNIGYFLWNDNRRTEPELTELIDSSTIIPRLLQNERSSQEWCGLLLTLHLPPVTAAPGGWESLHSTAPRDQQYLSVRGHPV
jgi:hypothetical protein